MAGVRDRALLLTGLAGAFRRSERWVLVLGDLEFRPAGVVATLRRSKTDQEEGWSVAIGKLAEVVVLSGAGVVGVAGGEPGGGGGRRRCSGR